MSTKPTERLTKDDYYAIFQTNPLGHQVFCDLYTRFVTNKKFNPDPYINAYNCGMAEVINYITMRQTQDDSVQPAKENIFNLEPMNNG